MHTLRLCVVASATKWNVSGADLINKFAGELQFDALIAFEDEAIRVVGSIIEDTPIGLDRIENGKIIRGGVTRNNWQVARKPNDRILKTPKKSKGRGFAEKNIRGKFATVSRKGVRAASNKSIFLFNNAKNIRVLEFGGFTKNPKLGTYNFRTKSYEIRSMRGYSKQAPIGMMRRNVNSMRNRLRKRISKL